MNCAQERRCLYPQNRLDRERQSGQTGDSQSKHRQPAQESDVGPGVAAVSMDVKRAVPGHRQKEYATGQGVDQNAPLDCGVEGQRCDGQPGDRFEHKDGHAALRQF